MAHKMTTKRRAAESALLTEGLRRVKIAQEDSDTLYQTLESLGYWWDASQGTWVKGKPPSTTIFQDDDGEATGVIRVRLMGHPDDMPKAIAAAKRAFKVSDVSDPYPNRKGSGVRIYIDAVLKPD